MDKTGAGIRSKLLAVDYASHCAEVAVLEERLLRDLAGIRPRTATVPFFSTVVLAATTLPLLILLALAAFLPISEIAQVGRQLADTIASTRRLHAVHAQIPPVEDGTMRLTPAQLATLLEGLEWRRIEPRDVVRPSATQ